MRRLRSNIALATVTAATLAAPLPRPAARSPRRDNYSAVLRFRVARSWINLPDGLHTIRIQALGTKRSASTDTFVAVDGWTVV